MLQRDRQGRFIKGHVPWNVGLTKENDPNCKCKQCEKTFRLKPSAVKRGRGVFCSKGCQAEWQSENLCGSSHPFYGKHHTKEAIEKNRLRHLGKNNPNYGNPRSLETRQKIKVTNLETYSKPETWKNWLKGTSRRPTTPEKLVIKLIDNNTLPFRYVGDGRENIGNMCPDFIHTEREKKVLEVFGDYWHEGEEAQKRVRAFNQHGYECLIIWEHDLVNEEETLRKVEEFLYA